MNDKEGEILIKKFKSLLKRDRIFHRAGGEKEYFTETKKKDGE